MRAAIRWPVKLKEVCDVRCDDETCASWKHKAPAYEKAIAALALAAVVDHRRQRVVDVNQGGRDEKF